MIKKDIKNYGRSGKARPLTVSKDSGIPYMTILVRYVQERPLYKVMQSLLQKYEEKSKLQRKVAKKITMNAFIVNSGNTLGAPAIPFIAFSANRLLLHDHFLAIDDVDATLHWLGYFLTLQRVDGRITILYFGQVNAVYNIVAAFIL